MLAVVGGAGYIGSHMVKLLRQRGESVVVFDNFSRGHRAACRGVTVVEGDLRSDDDLDRLFAKRDVECVLHFAGLSSVGESVLAPERYYENNVVGCWQLLEAMRRHHVPTMIFSSSAATYGEPRLVPIPEDHPQEPTNPYGESKKVMEQMLAGTGARTASARCRCATQCAGADPTASWARTTTEEHLIRSCCSLRSASGHGQVFGTDWPTPDGTCLRDYVHVTDLVAAHFLALERLRAGIQYEAFNLGNGAGYSVLEVLRTAEAVTGKTIPWTSAPRRDGDPARLVASAERAREVLGWRPQYPQLEAIVQTAWAWRQNHPGSNEANRSGVDCTPKPAVFRHFAARPAGAPAPVSCRAQPAGSAAVSPRLPNLFIGFVYDLRRPVTTSVTVRVYSTLESAP